jgi:hypothetical protein
VALLERLVLALELDANGAVARARQFEQEIGRALTPVEKLQQQLKLGFNVGLGAAGATSLVDGAKQAASAAFQIVKSSVEAQSQLNEQQSRSTIVFGQSATALKQFADSAAESAGLSKRAALDATSTFGLLFTQIGKTNEESAEYSVTLTKLAADLASFTDTTTQEAVNAIRSGLTGEIEPLRRYGVFLNDATLRQRALNMGIYDGNGILTSAQRAQAAYAEILAQTTKAQGDFERTSGGLANQQRILTANIENLRASFGAGLVPALADGTSRLNEFLPLVDKGVVAFAAYQQAALGAAQGLGELAVSLPIVGGNLQQLNDLLFGDFTQGTILNDFVEAARDGLPAIQALAAETSGVGGVFARAFISASGYVAETRNQVAMTAEEVAKLGNFMSDTLGSLFKQDSFNSALETLTQERTGGAAAAKARVLSEFEIESAARNVTRANEELAEAEKELADLRKGASEEERRRAEFEITNAAQRSRVAQVRLAEAENELRRTQARGTTAEQTRAQLVYEQALLDVQNATEDQSEAQRRKNELEQRGADGSKDLAEAVRRVEDAQFGVKSAYESQRRLFEQDAQSGGGPGAAVGRSMESAFKSAQKAASDIITEMVKAGKPIDEIIAKADELRIANLEAGKAAGLPQSLIDRADAYYQYLIALARYQNYLNTTFKLGQDPDGYEGLALGQQIDGARSRFEAAGRAMGGAVQGGKWYEVNESRREYFKPNGSGTIVPLGAGGFGSTVIIDAKGAVIASSVDMERLVTDALERARKRGWN